MGDKSHLPHTMHAWGIINIWVKEGKYIIFTAIVDSHLHVYWLTKAFIMLCIRGFLLNNQNKTYYDTIQVKFLMKNYITRIH